MATTGFTGIEDIAYANLAGNGKKARKIVNNAPTGDLLSDSSQLSSTGDTWGYFEETTDASIDKYSVFFFFEASSVNTGACTYTTSTASTKYDIYNKIYHLTGDTKNANIYAIKLTFDERYETVAGQSATYTTIINIKTNDPDLAALQKTITVTHNFCPALS